ncbi:MAG: hypothetical protein QG656_2149, partial [Candidatus Hydrogenedentes bacterium]|nr:hypothetical protein [Candidatus Hydrogenedentota bacterium]
DMEMVGSTLYVAGAFNTIGWQERNSDAAVDTTTGQVTEWSPNPGCDLANKPREPYRYVDALAISGKTAYIGGAFTTIGGQPRDHVGAVDTITGLPSEWNPGAGGDLQDPRPYQQFIQYSGVYALAVSGTTVYVGGPAKTIGQPPRPYFAQFDAVEK